MPTMIQSPSSARQRQGRVWPVVLLNLLLGIPGVIPVGMVWYFLANGPFAALRLPMRNPTENDGMLPIIIVIGPFVVGSALIWFLLNRLLIKKPRLHRKRLWLLGAVMSLVVPFPLYVALSMM